MEIIDLDVKDTGHNDAEQNLLDTPIRKRIFSLAWAWLQLHRARPALVVLTMTVLESFQLLGFAFNPLVSEG
ncbi:MAG: hypothetical protein P4M11_03655 [Candidatus Pacebacteria bacterium]|nr:hypothetical protein [Candidatus Paceibacterota bacterium]